MTHLTIKQLAKRAAYKQAMDSAARRDSTGSIVIAETYSWSSVMPLLSWGS